MRTRATAAATVAASGALALSVLTAPAAIAGTATSSSTATATTATTATTTAVSQDDSGFEVLKGAVNGGAPIVVGTSTTKKIKVAATVSHEDGVAAARFTLYSGKSFDDPAKRVLATSTAWRSCEEAYAIIVNCDATFTIDPKKLRNTDARTWRLAIDAKLGENDSYAFNGDVATGTLQRAPKLTVKAAPKPVKKGKTLTVTGKLSRANWDVKAYKGYAGQSVKLQFRKKNSDSYTTVKTVKTSSTGTLKTTTKKTSASGYWRWNFAGTATTAPLKTAGTLVSVK
ncbi:calcium-binding protein [Streptomyces paludis]|uniref:calcium-binding protein n=1 Tax=Streptomyces paludis TaxID=2282738 RepID=UPI0013B39DEE|nr:calcium-binding protein [Streptomyces paludis]